MESPAPVAVPIPEAWKAEMPDEPGAGVRILLRTTSGIREVSAQFEPADTHAGTPDRLWFLFRATRENIGKPIQLALPPMLAEKTPAYASRYEAPRLEIRSPDGEPILGYHHGKPIMERHYPLNDFIHPLIGLDGEVLTARSPGDHIHHRGIFWAWVRHEIDGANIGDWWHPTNIHAEARDIQHADGPVFATFSARHDWIHTPKEGEDKGKPLPFVAEHVVCRVFQTLPEGRAVDVDLSLRGLVPNVRIGGTLAKDKGYGGMTIRFAAADDALITSDSRIIREKSLNQVRASWIDWTGHFHDKEGKPAKQRSGAALMTSADHPDHPPLWITRYYGPINVSWPGMEMVDVPADKPIHLRYRIWVHRGDALGGNVEAHYRAYVADWKWSDGS